MNTDNRTDDELNKIIAEWCGWKCEPHASGTCLRDPSGYIVNNNYADDWRLPNYCRDLNAVHEAVMSIPVSERVHLNHVMCVMLRENDAYFLDRAINSTARQRAEALVRVIETKN